MFGDVIFLIAPEFWALGRERRIRYEPFPKTGKRGITTKTVLV